MLEAYAPYFAGRYPDACEIIVVVNGSTDGTAGVADGFKARGFNVRTIIDPRPIGKGGALMLGFRAATGTLIGFADADGSTPPEAFDDLVNHMEGADLVAASRWTRGADVSPRQPLDRRIASRMFNLLTNLLFGLRMTDTQCGAKLARGDVLKAVLPHLGVTQWAFDVDLLYQFRRGGHVIREIPTTWRDVGGSKLKVAQASTEMLLALVRLRLVHSPFRWLVRLYRPEWMPPALRYHNRF